MVTRPTAKKVKSLDELLQADEMFSAPVQNVKRQILANSNVKLFL